MLGTLVNFLAMKRVNVRGIKHANKCLIMAAIAYNLKKMLKFTKKTPIGAVASLRQEAADFFASLFFTPHFVRLIIKIPISSKIQLPRKVINRVVHTGAPKK